MSSTGKYLPLVKKITCSGGTKNWFFDSYKLYEMYYEQCMFTNKNLGTCTNDILCDLQWHYKLIHVV